MECAPPTGPRPPSASTLPLLSANVTTWPAVDEAAPRPFPAEPNKIQALEAALNLNGYATFATIVADGSATPGAVCSGNAAPPSAASVVAAPFNVWNDTTINCPSFGVAGNP